MEHKAFRKVLRLAYEVSTLSADNRHDFEDVVHDLDVERSRRIDQSVLFIKRTRVTRKY